MTEPSSESLTEPNLNSPNAPLPVVETAAKEHPQWLKYALKVWWIPTSYFIPYLVIFFFSTGTQVRLEDCLMRANRVGTLGLFAGVLVWAIWLIDCKFGAKQVFGKSRDTAAKTLIYLLGIALWVSWLGAGVVMTMSYDQVNSAPDMPSMQVP